MLGVVGEHYIKYPAESEDRVHNHDEVIRPVRPEGGDVSQEPVAGVRLQKREVHEDVPECCKKYMSMRPQEDRVGRRTGIESIHRRKEEEECQSRVGSVDAKDAQKDSRQNASRILSTIDKVRKYISRVSITSDALQETPRFEGKHTRRRMADSRERLPNWWQGGKEAQEP